MKIQFLGAAGTVTGSKYLVTVEGKRILVDCGMYQGVKTLRERNWQPFPVDPKSIDAILLTHAHIDHSGYIPALVKNGFKGRVYCTNATYELCKVLLPDSGFLQEEDARYANKKKFSRHEHAEPLYTEDDARKSLRLFDTIHYHEKLDLPAGMSATFRPVGHILGSSSILLEAGGKRVLFSGDIGRQNDLVMRSPEPLPECDYLLLESTYGNRLHDTIDPFTYLEEIINKTIKRGGIVLMPSFAVGRAQTMLYILQLLKEQDRIPDIPVYLNSPMAITATEIFCRHHKEHKLTAEDCTKIDAGTHYVRSAEESMALNNKKYPCVIISASGMASGGRVLHHLKSLVTHHNNSVVFLGFQAPGTRGDAMVSGASNIKIHGQYLPVKAEIHHFDALSAHADYQEIMTWLRTAPKPPRRTFIVHGEPVPADMMRLRIKDELGWKVNVPEYLSEVVLDD